MKKKLLLTLSILVMTSVVLAAHSKPTQNTELTNAIKLYKLGNYTECYDKLHSVVKNDPGNALAYYYLAITSAQVGKGVEAVANYERVLNLTPPNSNLARYANKGKRCIETPDKCTEPVFATSLEQFINNKKNDNISDEVKSTFEKLKIENIMREMNRSGDIDPQKFREYRDFSSMNFDSATPSNDEIVAAIRTLQKAGINNTGYTNNNSMLDIMENSNLNPQIMQALFANNMSSLGF